MRTDKNDWSSNLLKKVIKYLNFFCHINNMGVEVIWHRGSPHIYNISMIQTVSDPPFLILTWPTFNYLALAKMNFPLALPVYDD